MARAKTKASKLYVGKIFSLKAHKGIEIYQGRHKGKRVAQVSRDELGHVIITGETGKAVEVWTGYLGGMTVWLSKFYLHAEIKEEIEGSPAGELSKVIGDLADISRTMKQKTPALTLYTKKLDKLNRRLRLVLENLEVQN